MSDNFLHKPEENYYNLIDVVTSIPCLQFLFMDGIPFTKEQAAQLIALANKNSVLKDISLDVKRSVNEEVFRFMANEAKANFHVVESHFVYL